MLEDYIYKFFLFCGSEAFVFIFLVLGYLLYDQRKFGEATILVLFTIVLNGYLKEIFQVPINPEINTSARWAYPSGHTHINMVMWLYLIATIRKPWVFITPLLILPGNFLGMMHFNYHTWPHIVGGIWAAVLTVVPYYYFVKQSKFKSYTIGLILWALGFAIIFLLMPPLEHNYFWMWRSQGLLLGLIGSWWLYEKLYGEMEPKVNIILKSILSIAGVIAIYKLMGYWDFKIVDDFLNGILITIWAAFITPYAAQKFVCKNTSKENDSITN